MAFSFRNPATTGAQSSPVSTSSPVGTCMRGGYVYRIEQTGASAGGSDGGGGGDGGGSGNNSGDVDDGGGGSSSGNITDQRRNAPPTCVPWLYIGNVMKTRNNIHQYQMHGQHLST